MLESQALETTTELNEFGDIDSVYLESLLFELANEVFSFIVNDGVLANDSRVQGKFLSILVGEVHDFTTKVLDLFLAFFGKSIFVDSDQVITDGVHGSIQVIEFGVDEFESDDFHIVLFSKVTNNVLGVSLAVTDKNFTIPNHCFTRTFIVHTFRNSFTLNTNRSKVFNDILSFGETFIGGKSTENSLFIDGEDGVTEEAQFSQTFSGRNDID